MADKKPDEDEEEEETGETLEASGELEADIGAKFDQILSNIDPDIQWEIDPKMHAPMRPEMMFIREEMRMAKLQTLAVRRSVLKKLLLNDFIKEDKMLRSIGLAYSPQNP